jgi:hypothetical protein
LLPVLVGVLALGARARCSVPVPVFAKARLPLRDENQPHYR